MKVTLFKFGQEQNSIDLAPEIKGVGEDHIKFLMGRSDQCHIVLDDQMISREMAELVYENGSWKIKKITDRGDLFVNGISAAEASLTNGDVIKAGDYTLNVELTAADILDTKIPVKQSNEADELPEIGKDESDFDSSETSEFVMDEVAPEDPGVSEFVNAPAETAQEFTSEENAEYSEEQYDEYAEGEYAEGEYEDDGYGDNSYAMEALDDEKTGIIQTFAKYQLEIFGENAPYDSYLLLEGENFIGRNPDKCQIVLNDPEVSSVHAVVRKVGALITLEDMQSGNGTLHKGERVNKVNLDNGDEFIIGGTTFTLRVGSDFLSTEKETLMPVEENQFIEVEEIVEVDPNLEEGFDVGEPGADEKSIIMRIWKNPEKRKKAIIGLVVAVGLWVMFDEEPAPQPKKQQNKAAEAKKEAEKDSPLSKLSPAKKEKLDTEYLIAKEMLDLGKYTEALDHLAEVHKIVPEYKESKQLEDVAKNSLAKIAELEKKKQEEIARQEREAKVKLLVEKAREAVKDKNVVHARQIFNQVLEMDPNNFDIPLLKSEIDAWEKEEERKKIEAAQLKAERERKEKALKPGKNYWLKKEWYKAVLELEKFMDIDEMDDDLIQEGTKMLEDAQENLKSIVDPMIGKARSLVEGQDLKGAYEEYKKVLKYDPSHAESLNEINRIKELLNIRARKVYREAILSESLSLFEQAKEKYQELQQIAPADSEYYKKATEKLKEYIE